MSSSLSCLAHHHLNEDPRDGGEPNAGQDQEAEDRGPVHEGEVQWDVVGQAAVEVPAVDNDQAQHPADPHSNPTEPEAAGSQLVQGLVRPAGFLLSCS